MEADSAGQQNLSKAAQSALGETLESKRLAQWIRSIDKMTSADAPAIFELLRLEANAGRDFPTETTYFWQIWTAKDPETAWAFAKVHEETGGRNGAEAILKTWAMTDATKAGAVMAEMEDSPLAREALKGLMHGLAESRPEEAVKFATSRLPEDLVKEATIHIAGSMIYRLGNQEVQTWFDALPPGTPDLFRKEAAGVILDSLTRSAPGGVEKFAISRLDQPWMATMQQLTYISGMIRRNGSSPWNFVAEAVQHHPGLSPDTLVATVASSQTAAAQASQWTIENPEHPSLDTIIAGSAKALLKHNKQQEAAALLDRLRDQNLRESILGAAASAQ